MMKILNLRRIIYAQLVTGTKDIPFNNSNAMVCSGIFIMIIIVRHQMNMMIVTYYTLKHAT